MKEKLRCWTFEIQCSILFFTSVFLNLMTLGYARPPSSPAEAAKRVEERKNTLLCPSMRRSRRGGADGRSLVGVSRIAEMRYTSFTFRISRNLTTPLIKKKVLPQYAKGLDFQNPLLWRGQGEVLCLAVIFYFTNMFVNLPAAGTFFADNFKQFKGAACFVFFFTLLFQEPV